MQASNNQPIKNQGSRILIVDDDSQIRTLLRRILENEGYQVVEAADGVEGVRMYREDPADLVITDLVMPEKEGLELITELKNEDPNVKIIAISGGGRNDPEMYLHIAEHFGARHIFEKPLERERLVAAVRGLLEE